MNYLIIHLGILFINPCDKPEMTDNSITPAALSLEVLFNYKIQL